MSLVLHTLKKDIRHLWPAIAISLALLAVLAVADGGRSTPIVGTAEGWLNLLLPMAWACLVALAVLEEPLTGDRHFWLTRPHRWTTLLSAKVLFALLFVHLPALLADLYVLIARGFSPFECLPQLLGKQAMLAAVVTLPGIALATLVGGFTHFMMLLFAVSAIAAVVGGGLFRATPYMLRSADYIRTGALAAIVACAAVAIVVLQYRIRKLAVARTVAILTAVLAGTLFGYVPESFLLRANLHPVNSLKLNLVVPKPGCAGPSCSVEQTLAAGRDSRLAMYNRDTVAVPLTLSGVPAGTHYRVGAVELTLTTPDGSRHGNAMFTSENQPADVRLLVFMRRFPEDLESAPLNLIMHFNRALYAKLKDQHVHATGRVAVEFYRMGVTTSLPVNGRAVAPGIGHCSSVLSETRWSENMINVLCESPSPLPRTAYVTLAIPGIRREWNEWLRDTRTQISGPQWAWLSPLNRARTFFNTADSRTTVYKFGLEVPLEQIGRANVSVTPEIPAGSSLVDFDLPDLPLAANRIPSYSER